MKKRIVIITVFVLLSVFFSACAQAAPAETGSVGKKAAFIVSEPLGDPFTDMAVKGLQKALFEVGGDLKVIEAQSSAEYENQIRSLADLGYDPIVVVWDDLANAAVKVAEKYPDTHFLLFDTYVPNGDLPNTKNVTINPGPACYVAGYVAAKLSKTGKIADVLGADIPFVVGGFFAPWEAGAKAANPDVIVKTANAGTWVDPNIGRELALQLAEDGFDVIFDTANKTGLGVIQTAVEGDFLVMSTDFWKGDLSPNLVWSALKPGDEALYVATKSVFDGTFEPGVLDYGPAMGAALYDQRDFDKLPTDIQQEVLAVVEDLKAGKITIPTDTATR